MIEYTAAVSCRSHYIGIMFTKFIIADVIVSGYTGILIKVRLLMFHNGIKVLFDLHSGLSQSTNNEKVLGYVFAEC